MLKYCINFFILIFHRKLVYLSWWPVIWMVLATYQSSRSTNASTIFMVPRFSLRNKAGNLWLGSAGWWSTIYCNPFCRFSPHDKSDILGVTSFGSKVFTASLTKFILGRVKYVEFWFHSCILDLSFSSKLFSSYSDFIITKVKNFGKDFP